MWGNIVLSHDKSLSYLETGTYLRFFLGSTDQKQLNNDSRPILCENQVSLSSEGKLTKTIVLFIVLFLRQMKSFRRVQG